MTAPARRHTPRADCTADPDGTLVFELGDPGDPGDPGSGPVPHGAGEGPELVFRLRGGTGDDAVLRLPLGQTGGGRLRAVLPATAETAGGRWDVRLRGPGEDDEAAVPVEPGIRDLRHLVDRAPETGRVAVRVPYPTADGRLALHCWVRSPHAEAGTVTFDGDAMTVEGTLYGVPLGDGARAEARAPGDPGRVRRVPVTGKEGSFSFTLPLDGLGDGPVRDEQLWTLWLIPGTARGGPAGEVRVSRLLDDVWDRRNIFVYPGRDIGAGVRATPCYTGDNDLCVRVEPGPPPAG
ncbi:transferase [Streptomyces sp. NPDC014734]|uniref:transferase n=1 Tax=Streptomyces sp. NPDC014734 TaxID=3364886 RepID=UPI0036FA0525